MGGCEEESLSFTFLGPSPPVPPVLGVAIGFDAVVERVAFASAANEDERLMFIFRRGLGGAGAPSGPDMIYVPNEGEKLRWI